MLHHYVEGVKTKDYCMRTKLLVASFLGLFASVSTAQQDKLITHFMYDKMSLNPGATGIEGGICGTAMYRNQWDKVNGAPNSAVLNAEANISPFAWDAGVGISFYHDAIGFNRQNVVHLNYSHHFELNPLDGTLGVGLGLGIMNFGMNPEFLGPTTQIDQTFPTAYSAMGFDMNLGLYFKSNQNFYVGLSTTHLSESRVRSSVGDVEVGGFSTKRHYYLMGGYDFIGVLGGDIETNLLYRTDMVKHGVELNARYLWNNKIYGGLGYRTNDAVSILVGYKPMANLLVGYSYDITINRLAGVSRGTHEVMVKYCYYLPTPPVIKTKHPRWL